MASYTEGDETMERRIAERKEFRSILDFKLSACQSGTVTHKGRGVDVSSSGIGITSQYLLAQGMVVQIELPLQEIGITLPLFAEVAWAVPVGESFRAGLSFLR